MPLCVLTPHSPPDLTLHRADCADVGARATSDFFKSLDNLGVGYTDLLLMHWPGDFDETDVEVAKANRKAVWQAMEALQLKGSTKAIGVANFSGEEEPLPLLAPTNCQLHPAQLPTWRNC